MLTNFETAFANARKQGLSTFNYQGKSYTTKYREEKVLDDLFKAYPALGNVYNANNTKISMGDVKRQALNKQYGGGGGIEHWFPDEPGQKQYPHPTPGKYNLEFFDPVLFKDTERMKNAVLLDMLHGMKADPKFKALRDEFNKNWSPSELEFIKSKHKKEANPNESLAAWVDRTVLDGYLRGAFNPASNEALAGNTDQYALLYRGLYKENGKTVEAYSPQQRAIIDRMKTYMTTLK